MKKGLALPQFYSLLHLQMTLTLLIARIDQKYCQLLPLTPSLSIAQDLLFVTSKLQFYQLYLQSLAHCEPISLQR